MELTDLPKSVTPKCLLKNILEQQGQKGCWNSDTEEYYRYFCLTLIENMDRKHVQLVFK